MFRKILFITLIGISFLMGINAKASVMPKIPKKVKPARKNEESCSSIIARIEKKYGIPENLLAAVATVESNQRPWAVSARGKSRFFSTKESAVSFIEEQRLRGAKNIYIGCMQLCLKSHGAKFKNIAEVLDPQLNIDYAARLLKHLYEKFGSWESAVMHYNASSKKVSYKNRVFSIWGGEPSQVETISANLNSLQKDFRMGFGAVMKRAYCPNNI